MSRNTRAVIDLAALRHNFAQARQRVAADCKVLTVIKADGYGHGIVPIAKNLSHSNGFGVATFAEAMTLRESGIKQFILLLEGALSVQELEQAAQAGIGVVVHQPWQLQMLQRVSLAQPVIVWLKVNTGMHRLGIPVAEVMHYWQSLQACAQVEAVVLMTHMACADDANHPLNQRQQAAFEQVISQLESHNPGVKVQASLANSAATCRSAGMHYQWVRPGLMLFGACPLLECEARSLQLAPVMQLEASVVAINTAPAQAYVGYGAIWQAPSARTLAVVSIGYGDGYPRHVAGAYVLISGKQCPIVGRVSMDMLTVDVSHCAGVQIGSKVVLWGQGLPVETVAHWAGSVNYELLCQVTPRVQRHYINGLEE